MASELARRLDSVLTHRLLIEHAFASELAGMAFLPRLLVSLLLARLTDGNWLVRSAAVRALAGHDSREVTASLLARLAHDDDGSVRLAAVRALAGRGSPEVTASLLTQLTDDDWLVRSAAEALADRGSSEMTASLLTQLAHDDADIRSAAVKALSESQSPLTLLTLATRGSELPRSCWPSVIVAAERLMSRHYLQIEPAERTVLRDAIVRLTPTATTGQGVSR
jgi:HEAT repeat protein